MLYCWPLRGVSDSRDAAGVGLVAAFGGVTVGFAFELGLDLVSAACGDGTLGDWAGAEALVLLWLAMAATAGGATDWDDAAGWEGLLVVAVSFDEGFETPFSA